MQGGILKMGSRKTRPGFPVTALSTTFGTQGAPSSQLPPLTPGKVNTHCGPLAELTPLPELTDSRLPPKSGCKVPGTQANDSQTALFFLRSRGRRIERSVSESDLKEPATAPGPTLLVRLWDVVPRKRKQIVWVSDRAGTKTSSPSLWAKLLQQRQPVELFSLMKERKMRPGQRPCDPYYSHVRAYLAQTPERRFLSHI